MRYDGEVRALCGTVAAVWIGVIVGGLIAFPPFNFALGAALVAAAIEATFYVASGFPEAREWVRQLPNRGAWLAASVLPAYLIYAIGTGLFNWRGLVLLLVLAAASAWWFELLPPNNWTDGVFLTLVACGLLTDLASLLYPPLSAKVKSDYIGRILWLRLGYWALLVVRNRGDMGFGFLPKRKDWAIGLRYAAYCVAAAAVVLALIQPMKLKDNLTWSLTPLILLGTFVGFLWVVALSEELFARGVLQGDLTRSLRSEWAGVAATSLLFGLVHLNYSKEFPNWRMVLLAGVLGIFCGRATQLAGSIRAGMVTHALVVTLFRVLLTKR